MKRSFIWHGWILAFSTSVWSEGILVNDEYVVAQAQASQLDILANDQLPLGSTVLDVTFDPATIPNTFYAFNPITHQMLFIHNDEHFGFTDIRYTVRYFSGEEILTESAIVTITGSNSNSENTPPVAVDDEITLKPGQTIFVDALSNDTDADGDILYISSITDRALELQSTIINDQISISASENFAEAAAITYRVSDGVDESNQAEIRIMPDLPNQAPIANDDAVTLGATNSIRIQPLNNDGDAEDGVPSLTRIISVDPGSAIISGNEVIYTPPDGIFNIAEIVYEISDSDGATDQATISISQLINLPPIARDDSGETVSGRSISISPLNNDEDEDPSTLSIAVFAPPSHGSVSVSNKVLTYISDIGFSGGDSFSYIITDDIGQSSSAFINIAVSENYPPIAINDFKNTTVDTPLSIDVLLNDSDSDDDSINITSISSFSQGGVFDLAENNTVFFEPSPGFTGVAEATYTVADLSGSEASAVLRIRVHIDTPVIEEIQLTNVDAALIPAIFNSVEAGELGDFNAIQNLGDVTGNGADDLSLNLQETVRLGGADFNQCLLLEGSDLATLDYQQPLTSLPASSLTKIYSSKNLLNDDLAPVSGKFDADTVVDLIFSKNFGLIGYQGMNPSLSEVDISSMSSASSVSSATPRVQLTHSLDFNGDGIDDLAVALAGVGTTEPSKVRILFGPLLPFNSNSLSDNLSSTTYLDIEGFSTNSVLKESLSVTSGDFNGDGFSDIMIGQYDSDRAIADGKGIVVLVWGGYEIGQDVNLDDLEAGLNTGRASIIYPGVSEGIAIGAVVTSGDLNADGVDDIVLGNSFLNAPDPSRQMDSVTVIYGGFIENEFLSVSDFLLAKDAAYQIRKTRLSGTQIVGEIIQSTIVADINGDKYDDISILTQTGLSTLKGDDQIKPNLIDVGSMNTDLPILYTETLGLLPSVETADINGDTFSDIIISDDYRTGSKISLIFGGIHFR